jgi:hypothetical protein
MASSTRIDKILRQILSLSLPPLAGACGIDTDGFDPIACGPDNGPPQLITGVKPQDPADYVELRLLEDIGGRGSRTLESVGEKCATATDKTACEGKVAAATSEQGFFLGGCGDICPRHILIVNTGDDVNVVSTMEGVKAWAGPVDSPADAVLVAQLAGYGVACNNPERGGVRPAGNAYEVLATKLTASCTPVEVTRYVLGVDADGDLKEVESEVIESDSGSCIGRRPAGLSRIEGRGRTRVGAYFANVAELEAASVHAFDMLEQELLHHGAPRALVERARMARQDEVRHAQVMRRVSARYGGRFEEPRVERRPARSLEEIAIENAAEGCVRETFGALVGMWQASCARDPMVRRVMKRIARDETRHASLAWAIDAWVRPRLTPEARRRVEKARQAALRGIEEETRRGYDRALVAFAGMPGDAAARRLSRHFAEAVGAAAG